MSLMDERLLTLLYEPGGNLSKAIGLARSGQWRMPWCESPIPWELFQGQRDVHPLYDASGSGIIYVPCRRCPACQLVRRRMWFARCVAEINQAPRTWFLTLTYRSAAPGSDGGYPEVQRFLKRLRKQSMMRLRYMAVLEAGELHGRLHWHMMLHAQSSLTRRSVERCWTAGFSKAKLVPKTPVGMPLDQRTANIVGYLAHYSAKSLLRVHASNHYGQGPTLPVMSEPTGEDRQTGGDAGLPLRRLDATGGLDAPPSGGR